MTFARRYHAPPSLVGLLSSTTNHSLSSDHTPPGGCRSWFDGCNTCVVTSSGEISGCTYMACLQQGTPFCRRFSDGIICEDVACGHREQRSAVVEEAAEAQADDVVAEAAVRNLNVVAADGVLWLLCGWSLAMLFPAVRCAFLFACLPAFLLLCSRDTTTSSLKD